jgi:tetratricopeptide (TPR) repeat protein
MTTVRDLVQKAWRLARDEENHTAEILQHLQAAEEIAVDPRDWRDVGEAYAEYLCDGDRARASLERALTAQDADDVDPWTYHALASVYAELLTDKTATRDVLARAERAILESRPRRRTGHLCRLAGWTVAFLDEQDDARRLLQEAESWANDTHSLCEIASAAWEHLRDEALARTVLERAVNHTREQLQSPEGSRDISDWWPIANTYKEIGDEAAVQRCLEEGHTSSVSVEEFLAVAQAWASNFEGSSPGFERAMMAAQGLAQDTSEWWDIAETWFETEQLSGILECLEQGLAVAADDKDRRKVADGFRTFLKDKARADSIAPSGFRPEHIAHQRQKLDGFTADPTGLFDVLRTQMTEEMLQDIAGADYGNDYEQNLVHLNDICTSGTIPNPLSGDLLEVLQLKHWGTGDEVNHVQRAFVCTVLGIEFCGAECGSDGHQSVFPVLIESCLALGDPAMACLDGLMIAAVEGALDFDSSYLFALYGLFLARVAQDPSDERLVALAETLEATEPQFGGEGDEPDYPKPEHGWLLRTTFFDQRHDLWRDLGQRILGHAVQQNPSLSHLARIWDQLDT